MMAAWPAAVASLAAAVESGEMDGELRACSAANLCVYGVSWEGLCKVAPDARAVLDARWVPTYKSALNSVSKVLTAESFAKVIPRAAELQRRLLEEQTDEGLSLACGAVTFVTKNTFLVRLRSPAGVPGDQHASEALRTRLQRAPDRGRLKLP